MLTSCIKYFALCFAATSAYVTFAGTTATVTDVQGNTVEVSIAEIRRAYFNTFEPYGENHKIENGDGSVAIINPTFKYAGKSIPFRQSSHGLVGVCKYLKFQSEHGHEVIDVPGPGVSAVMKDDGTLNYIRHEQLSSDQDLVRVIVCSNRPQ